jgi:chemotaxis response regulator CheB
MRFTDLLIDRMSPLTRAIVDEAVSQCPGIRIVAQDVPAADLVTMVTRHTPDVVLLGSPAAFGDTDAALRLLGAPRLPTRVITLFEASRGGSLIEWRRTVSRVEPLSTLSLCRALAGSEDKDG